MDKPADFVIFAEGEYVLAEGFGGEVDAGGVVGVILLEEECSVAGIVVGFSVLERPDFDTAGVGFSAEPGEQAARALSAWSWASREMGEGRGRGSSAGGLRQLQQALRRAAAVAAARDLRRAGLCMPSSDLRLAQVVLFYGGVANVFGEDATWQARAGAHVMM